MIVSVLHQNSGGNGKSIPDAQEISLLTLLKSILPFWLMMRECPYSTKTRELLGNRSPLPSRFPSTLEISGLGKSFGRRGWISQYLPRLGGARIHSWRSTDFWSVSPVCGHFPYHHIIALLGKDIYQWNCTSIYNTFVAFMVVICLLQCGVTLG